MGKKTGGMRLKLPRPGWGTAVAISAAGCFLLGGCFGDETGPTIAPVSGAVTFDGQPVESGRITFAEEEQGLLFSTDIKNGSYTVRTRHGAGMPLGDYQVKITPPPPDAPANPASPAEVGPTPDAPDIPEKYRDFSTSGLTAEVKAGSNTFDFEMKAE
jgi:hypothetical protein